ncbi:transposase [Streptomyces sp. NPDC002676]
MDDFAFRKGKAYGTVLVDVDASTVIDLLPDRSSDTLIAWLAKYPGAEVICRDRDSSYSCTETTACRDAVQVADRRRLLQSLSRAVEQVWHQHRGCLEKHAELGRDQPVQIPLLGALPPTLVVQRVLDRHEEFNRGRCSTGPDSRCCTRSACEARRPAVDRP